MASPGFPRSTAAPARREDARGAYEFAGRAHVVHDVANQIEDVAEDLSAHVDDIADELAVARVRLGRGFRKLEAALGDLGASTERPAARVARAAEELAREAVESYDRVVGKRRRPWYQFWI